MNAPTVPSAEQVLRLAIRIGAMRAGTELAAAMAILPKALKLVKVVAILRDVSEAEALDVVRLDLASGIHNPDSYELGSFKDRWLPNVLIHFDYPHELEHVRRKTLRVVK